MRGFRLSRPASGGAPRRSLREEAETEAAAELRRVMEQAGVPAADLGPAWSPPAAHGAGDVDRGTVENPADLDPGALDDGAADLDPGDVEAVGRPVDDADLDPGGRYVEADAGGGSPAEEAPRTVRRVRKAPPAGADRRPAAGAGAREGARRRG